MEIQLYKEDLQEEFQHLSSNQVKFEHLNLNAQAVVTLAGRGVYWSSVTSAYGPIYPPPIPSSDKSP